MAEDLRSGLDSEAALIVTSLIPLAARRWSAPATPSLTGAMDDGLNALTDGMADAMGMGHAQSVSEAAHTAIGALVACAA